MISFGESRPEPEADQEELSQRQTEYSAFKPCSEQEEATWSLIYIYHGVLSYSEPPSANIKSLTV